MAPQKDAGQTGEVSPFTQGACDSGEENPHRREPGRAMTTSPGAQGILWGVNLQVFPDFS